MVKTVPGTERALLENLVFVMKIGYTGRDVSTNDRPGWLRGAAADTRQARAASHPLHTKTRPPNSLGGRARLKRDQ